MDRRFIASRGLSMWTCLYTIHAYRSWMPDHPEGYVRRKGEVILPPDEALANKRSNMAKGAPVIWELQHQRMILEAIHELVQVYESKLHAIIANPTHVHILVSCPDQRNPEKIGSAIKRRITKGLNETFGKRETSWMSRKFHWKMINKMDHFKQLIQSYLPNHKSKDTTVWINPDYKISR